MSTIPAVVDRMVVVPYWMDSLIPQNSFEGEVPVMGLCYLNLKSSSINKWKRAHVKVIEPVNLELSVPPVEYFNIRVDVLNNNCTHPR